jgi:hypothetical protein
MFFFYSHMCNLEKDLQVGGVLGNEKGALGGEGTSGVMGGEI